jgi:hypothetical protein
LDEWLRLSEGWKHGELLDDEAYALTDAHHDAYSTALAMEPANLIELRTQIEFALLEVADHPSDGVTESSVNLLQNGAHLFMKMAP